MDPNLIANIIEGVFLFFLHTYKRQKFTLNEIKNIFATRYNWIWDNTLEQGLDLLTERYKNYESGVFIYPDTDQYEWRNSSLDQNDWHYHKNLLLTWISIKTT